MRNRDLGIFAKESYAPYSIYIKTSQAACLRLSNQISPSPSPFPVKQSHVFPIPTPPLPNIIQHRNIISPPPSISSCRAINSDTPRTASLPPPSSSIDLHLPHHPIQPLLHPSILPSVQINPPMPALINVGCAIHGLVDVGGDGGWGGGGGAWMGKMGLVGGVVLEGWG